MGKIKPSQIKKIYKRFGDPEWLLSAYFGGLFHRLRGFIGDTLNTQDIDVDKSGAIDYEEFIQAFQ